MTDHDVEEWIRTLLREPPVGVYRGHWLDWRTWGNAHAVSDDLLPSTS